MKKILSVVLSLIMIFSMFALGGVTSSASNPSGSCGEGVVWEYSQETKTLTILGSGYMTDYVYDNGAYNRPWEAYIAEIECVIIGDGVLSVGDFAFIDCQRLGDVKVSDTVLTIGEGAFQSCIRLRFMDIGKNVVAIGPSAFKDCGLRHIKLSKNTVYIGRDAFTGCLYGTVTYTGVNEQKNLIFYEDEYNKLGNVVYADTEYDISVDIDSYVVYSAIAIESFEFTMTDDNIAQIIEAEYSTVVENGVTYYIGTVAVVGIDTGTTVIYAETENERRIGAFSVLVGECIYGHHYKETFNTYRGTCIEREYKYIECERCSTSKLVLGDFGDHLINYFPVEEATCQTAGLERGVCGICKEELEREIPITDHNWTDWEVTVAPTEETEGEKERHCVECGRPQKETMPPISTLIGDVNCDGDVTAFDARLALQCAAGNMELDECYFKLADVTGDGEISAIDARKILQIAANS